MPLDIAELLAPARTAVLTMELQRGVVGSSAKIPMLADEVAETGLLERAGAVCRAARAAGARVVHCTAEFRADAAGSGENAPLLRRLATTSPHPHPVVGTEAAAVVPELGPEPSDLISPRLHGLTPFPGTELDAMLRNLGVTTVVTLGVSANVGIPGMVMGAVDLGYHAVVVTDAIAGIPREYTAQVIEHTLAQLATRLTSDEVIAAW
jgi:nicotinamidase-related amidase